MPTSVSAPEPTAARLGRHLLLGLALGLLAVFVFVACLYPIAVTDFWWQARTGEIIVRTGRIPTRDELSWTAAGNPWVVHEWLTEVLFYWLLTATPRWSLLLYKAGLACVACGLVLGRAWRRSGSAPFSIAATALAALVVRNFADLRPQMLTFVLLAGALWALDEYRRGNARRLPWLLPPVFALWANLHGGVVVGLLLLTLWTVGDWIAATWLGGSGKGLRPLLLAVGASWLAAMLNPNGFHVYVYPFQVLGHPEVQDYITEWFSPNFHRPAVRPFEVLLLLLLGVAALVGARVEGRRSGAESSSLPAGDDRPNRDSRASGAGRIRITRRNRVNRIIPGGHPFLPLGETLMLLAMVHAALVAQRNTAPFALAAAPVVAAGAALLWRDLARGALDRLLHRPSLRAAGLLLLCAGLGQGIAYYRPAGPPSGWVDAALDLPAFPRDATPWLRQGRWPGRMYNDYIWGGYLSWELYPDRKVFIDGRAEVYYPNGVFEDEMAIHRTSRDWEGRLRKRGVQVVLTQSHDALAARLRQSAEWDLVFTGKVESVFVRRVQER